MERSHYQRDHNSGLSAPFSTGSPSHHRQLPFAHQQKGRFSHYLLFQTNKFDKVCVQINAMEIFILGIKYPDLDYSYRRASTGSRLEARLAGYNPKNKPTAVEKMVANNIAFSPTVG